MRKLMANGTLVDIEAPKGSQELMEEAEIKAKNKANGIAERKVKSFAEKRELRRQAQAK